jgi:hypothetical protein
VGVADKLAPLFPQCTIVRDDFTVNGNNVQQTRDPLGANVVNQTLLLANVPNLNLFGDGGNDFFTVNLAGSTGITTVNFNGQTGNDTFSITPHASVEINVDGGAPSLPTTPGDTLGYIAIGTVSSSGPGAGTINGAGVQPVDFVDIETILTSTPTIIANPANQTITAGGTAFFTAAATASAPLTVQWQVSSNGGATWSNLGNGGNFSGVTTTTLTVSQALANLNGYQFRAVFTTTTDFVSTATAAASLTVNSGYAYAAYANACNAYLYAYTTSNGSSNSYLAYINAASALTWASYANYYSSIGQTATAAYYASLAQSYSLVAAYYSYLVYSATGNIYAYYAWYFATNSYYYSYYTSQGY